MTEERATQIAESAAGVSARDTIGMLGAILWVMLQILGEARAMRACLVPSDGIPLTPEPSKRRGGKRG